MSFNIERIDKYRIRLHKSNNMKTDAIIFASDEIKVEDNAIEQLQNACSIDEEAKVFATPDIHTGYGIPIGSIFASQHFISPSAVGYDINCGMRLLSTGITAEKNNLKQIVNLISKEIPLGEGKKNLFFGDNSFIRLLKKGVSGIEEISTHEKINKLFDLNDFESDLKSIEEHGCIKGGDISKTLVHAIERGKSQLGTLGGGNHFIEIEEVTDIYDQDIAKQWGIDQNELCIMIHSGSRGFGHEIAGYFMKKAISFCEKNKLFLPDRQFNYFLADNNEGEEYFNAMNLAANFAFINRELMAMFVRKSLRSFYPGLKMPLLYDISHNIVKKEMYNNKMYYVHRKGATRSFDKTRMNNTRFSNTGQPVLIPGSMGTSSYLLAGIESGIESFFSVNHGAGRVMGRKAAAGKIKKGRVIKQGLISDADFKKQMDGIFLVCENKYSIKEEAPAAYKDIDKIIDIVSGANLAKKVIRLRPLAVLKG
jgi:tRNA-splicing ligase RtcB